MELFMAKNKKEVPKEKYYEEELSEHMANTARRYTLINTLKSLSDKEIIRVQLYIKNNFMDADR